MREVYHQLHTFNHAGLTLFLDHAKQYLRGERTIPVLKIPGMNGNSVTLTLTNDLLLDATEYPEKYEKPIEVALKFGFRGYSRGGKNGVFLQRKQDEALHAATDRAMRDAAQEVMEDLVVPIEGLDDLKRIKVVWHGPDRLVGVYESQQNHAILLDWATY